MRCSPNKTFGEYSRTRVRPDALKLRAEDDFSDENITIEDALWDFDPFQPPRQRIWVGDGIGWIK